MKRAVPALAFFVIATVSLAAAFSVACGDDDPGGPRIVLAIARGGLGDRAFNDSANAGLQRAADEIHADVSVVEFKDGDAQIQNLRDAAKGDFDLFIAIGAENVPALKVVAAENPAKHFAVIDTTLDAPNVTSVTFKELEGDYLVGALCALMSPSGKVAFLGGADIDVIRRIGWGWKEGVLAVNPNATILVDYVGGKDDFSGFAKPDVAKDRTAKLYQAGADIVYAAAGGSQLGAIEEAKAEGKLIITAGTDQRHLAPDSVVTSRIKDMSAVVFMLATEAKDGALQAGMRVLDFRSGAIALAPYDGVLVSAAVLARFRTMVEDMRDGKITVTPYTPSP